MNGKTAKSLKLPKHNYGPFCLKILSEFIAHHNIQKGLPIPCPGLSLEDSLSRIFDIMLHSMGEQKRLEILEDLEKYNMSLPACLR